MSWLLPLKRETEKNGFSMNYEFYTNVFRKDVGMPKIIEKWYINGMRGLFRKKNLEAKSVLTKLVFPILLEKVAYTYVNVIDVSE